MRPFSEPSLDNVAEPRPLTASLSSLPSHENSTPGAPAQSTAAMSIQPSTAMYRKLPVPSARISMKAGPTRSIASRSRSSISTMRQRPPDLHEPQSRSVARRIVQCMPLKPGDKAPAFTLLDQHGNKVRLSDFKGRRVLIYFYPKG